MAEREGNRKVREATWAGIFYDEEAEALDRRIQGLLEGAETGGERTAGAIFSPHASLDYSGDLAALAWASCAERKPSRILIVGPWHRATESSLWLSESQSFEGPFGSLEVDRRSVTELLDCGTFGVMGDLPHLEEHSIELQLPFAARLFPGVPIVPLLTGRPSQGLIRALASSLALVFGKKSSSTLIVISSDLEFAASPEEARIRSDRFLELLQSGRGQALGEELVAGRLRSCGGVAAAALLESGLFGTPRLLGRHGSPARREEEEEAYGDYAALGFF